MIQIAKITRRLRRLILIAAVGFLLFTGAPQPVMAACESGSHSYVPNLLGIPPWYKYLEDESTEFQNAAGRCVPKVSEFKDGLLILLAIIEILLRVVTYVAIAMFIYGGIRLIISQGSPDEIKKARDTITNAVVGLVIALIATGIVNFVGRSLG